MDATKIMDYVMCVWCVLVDYQRSARLGSALGEPQPQPTPLHVMLAYGSRSTDLHGHRRARPTFVQHSAQLHGATVRVSSALCDPQTVWRHMAEGYIYCTYSTS